MGYERKLYVVSEHTESRSNEFHWAEDIAMFDVSKCDTLYDVKWEDANCYLFDIDGNTHITEDRYGDRIKSADPEEVAKCLEKAWKKYHYWRAKTAASLIRNIVKDNDTRDNIRVYSYGY